MMALRRKIASTYLFNEKGSSEGIFTDVNMMRTFRGLSVITDTPEYLQK